MKHDLLTFFILAVLAASSLANFVSTADLKGEVKSLKIIAGKLPDVVEVERMGCPCGKSCKCCPCPRELAR